MQSDLSKKSHAPSKGKPHRMALNFNVRLVTFELLSSTQLDRLRVSLANHLSFTLLHRKPERTDMPSPPGYSGTSQIVAESVKKIDQKLLVKVRA
jgi:hypothetical protein